MTLWRRLTARLARDPKLQDAVGGGLGVVLIVALKLWLTGEL